MEIEEFLPTPHALCIVEQGNPSYSVPDSLVGALNQVQAIQQQKSQRPVMDITTWVRYFMLYMAVLSSRVPEMVPSMVAHLHTVLHLQQRASHNLAWFEYDIKFRMEMADSADLAWKCGDPWQYMASAWPASPKRPLCGGRGGHHIGYKGKRKAPAESGGRERSPNLTPEKVEEGICRLHNTTLWGFPYGRECIFSHRCTGCGAMDEHGHIS